MSFLIPMAEERFHDFRRAVAAHHRRKDWAFGLTVFAALVTGICGRAWGLAAMAVAVVTFVVVARRLSARRREAHEALMGAIDRLRAGDEAEQEFGDQLSRRTIAFLDGVVAGLGGVS